MEPVAHRSEGEPRGRSAYRIPRREFLWALPMLLAAGLGAAEFAIGWFVDTAVLVTEWRPTYFPFAVVGTLVWMGLISLGLCLRFIPSRITRSTLAIDAERRSVYDARGGTDLACASAVEVKPLFWLLWTQVVVKNASGDVQWASPGLRYSQARAFAMDLAEMLSLSLPEEPDRKAVSLGHFDRAVFAQDRDSIRIGVWSEPIYGVARLAFLPMLLVMLGGPLGALPLLFTFPRMAVGVLHFHVPVLLMTALVTVFLRRLPRWTELEIRDDRLVVREGWWLQRVQTLPLTIVAPPRLVRGIYTLPALVVRTHDGQHFEWVGRSEEVLRRMQQWVVYAQGLGVPAAPPPPAALVELASSQQGLVAGVAAK